MNRRIYHIVLIVCVVSVIKSHGQNTGQKVPVSDILEQLDVDYALTFNYESSLLKGLSIVPTVQSANLSSKLKNIEAQTNLVFEKVSNTLYTISKAIKWCGYLIDSEFEQPLIGATVHSQSKYAVSDDSGYFEIKLKSIKDVVTIRHIGFKTIDRQVQTLDPENCETLIMYVHQESIAPVLIETYIVRGIDKRKDWTTSIDYKRFSLLPGLIESDVLQTVQALPSILSVDETVSNINMRGGSHDQNLILWDDIKMYQTGHFFGLISSFNPLMTQSASVINNGSDVALTDGVSGTIHMHTNNQIDQKFHGVFGINFLNAELFSNMPIGKNSSLQLATRASLDDLVRTPIYDVYFDRITQDTEAEVNAFNVTNSDQQFNFHDVSIRWLYQPTDRDFLRINFILIHNDLGFNETANINGLPRTRRSSISQNTFAVGLNYKRQWSDRFSSTINIYDNEYKLDALNADILNNQLQLQENIVSESSVRLNNSYEHRRWRFNLGYQFTETEVINLNDIDLPRFVRRDEEILRTHGVFGQAWFKSVDNNFSARAGVRTNFLTRFGKFLVEPRISLRQGVGSHVEIEVQGEFKHQSTSQIVNFQNDFLGIEKRRWQLTDNDSIPVLMSKQASIGVLFRKNGWLLDTKGFYKIVDGVTAQSQSFTTKYEFTKAKGSYDVYGLEFLCRKTYGSFNSWLSYAYQKNTYTFNSLEEVEFPSNFDITHSVSFGTTFSSASWHISAGMNYRTGKPTSIPDSANDIVDGTISFSKANNENLVDYFRIDASAIYKFKLGKTVRSEIGASIWNISNRNNTINHYYRINENDVVDRFSRYSLGLTTNAVWRVYF